MLPLLPMLLIIMFEAAAPAQTSNAMLFVATYFDVQLSSTGQGISLIKQYREASRMEQGNSNIDVVQEIARPNRFVIIEVWNPSSFEAHERAEHTVQFRARLKAIYNTPFDQRVHLGFAI